MSSGTASATSGKARKETGMSKDILAEIMSGDLHCMDCGSPSPALMEMYDLPVDWQTDGTPPPDNVALGRAGAVIEQMKALPLADNEGGASLQWEHKDLFFSIDIENDGTVALCIMKGDEGYDIEGKW